MRKLALSVFAMTILSTILSPSMAQARDLQRVSCTGWVSFETGTMEGRMTVTAERRQNGEWTVNDHIAAGKDRSLDSNSLSLDTYGGWFNCKGATFEYDVLRRTLNFRYKYDSGILGGGCQKTRGEFTDCVHE